MQIAAVHLDLKGVLFRPEYIPELLRDLAGQGINAVLVEYEDVFPFRCVELARDRESRWSRETLRAFQNAAAANGIEIIPLQQCLGHLEYLLRWSRYRHLSEDPAEAATIAATDAEARELITAMLNEILEAHPQSTYVHLGMDEARALVTSPRVQERGGPLPVFLDHLRHLCDLVESHGKTPIIWSDMLEDHFETGAFEGFADRVVLAPWDYTCGTRPMKRIRLRGHRTVRNDSEPSRDTLLIDDLPADILALIEPYRTADGLIPLFQVDLWTRLGFRVLGGTVLRYSAQGPILPDYNRNRENIIAWRDAIERTNQLGLIATSWARANTFYPPNLRIDVLWPLVTEFAQALGHQPEPFWPGISAADVQRLVQALGHCRAGRSGEEALADEMAAMAPALHAHRFEWKSMEWMARTLHVDKSLRRCLAETEPFLSGSRLPASHWERYIRKQEDVRAELQRLRGLVDRHFRQRFAGEAYEEWLHLVFDWQARRLREHTTLCRRRLQDARDTQPPP